MSRVLDPPPLGSYDSLFLKLKDTAKVIGIIGFFKFDFESINQREENSGTIAHDPDVASYGSLTGILRPYILSLNAATIIYGIAERNVDTISYGLSSLPYSLSLYVRDGQSGGLIDRIKSNFQEMKAQPVKAKA